MKIARPDSAELLQSLRHARNVAVLTGAGISAESGVPTFRDAQTGLWATYRPEDLATPEAYQRNPALVWQWYRWRRAQVAAAVPNPGHFALVEIERRIPVVTLITQNVDGLHQRAGSRNVVELHGNITRVRCSMDERVPDEWHDPGDEPPRCVHCGAALRPDVVWFGEVLPAKAIAAAEAAASACDLFLSIGTSSVVYPAAALPYIALRSGATLIEVNSEETPLTPSATHVLRGSSGTLLPALVRAAWE